MQSDIDDKKSPQTLSKRLLWLDFAKSYGMILVFLGHILESLFGHGFESSFLPYKFIYSFHIPLFFILSGYVSKSTKDSFGDFLKPRLNSRLVPFLFFNFIAFLGIFLLDSLTGSLNISGYLRNILLLLLGVPAFNIITWFLACLFSVEIIHFAIERIFRSDTLKVAASLFLFCLGLFLTLQYRQLTLKFWLFPEALVAHIFYRLGFMVRQYGYFDKHNRWWNLAGFPVSLVLTLLTFNLNQGLFSIKPSIPPVVIMSFSSHGQPLLFLLTGISGSLMVIYLARWSASNIFFTTLQTRLGISFIGLNTLILLGLNGLLLKVNYEVSKRLVVWLPDTSIAVLTVSIVLTVISILLCVPAVFILKRYFPRFVGLRK